MRSKRGAYSHMTFTAMAAARSLGKPYAPVLMAGKAMLRLSLARASSKLLR